MRKRGIDDLVGQKTPDKKIIRAIYLVNIA